MPTNRRAFQTSMKTPRATATEKSSASPWNRRKLDRPMAKSVARSRTAIVAERKGRASEGGNEDSVEEAAAGDGWSGIGAFPEFACEGLEIGMASPLFVSESMERFGERPGNPFAKSIVR